MDDKSTEITALPELRAMRHLHGRVVTMDAMGGQGEVARQVVAQGGDDVRSLKEPHPGIHWECAELFAWLRGPHPMAEDVGLGCDAQVDGGHGRLETRKGWSTEALAGVEACARWPGLTP